MHLCTTGLFFNINLNKGHYRCPIGICQFSLSLYLCPKCSDENISLAPHFRTVFVHLFTFPAHEGIFGQRLFVLHCNYNGDVAPKFGLVITFDFGSYRPKRSTNLNCIQDDRFRDTTLHHILRAQVRALNMTNTRIFG